MVYAGETAVNDVDFWSIHTSPGTGSTRPRSVPWRPTGVTQSLRYARPHCRLYVRSWKLFSSCFSPRSMSDAMEDLEEKERNRLGTEWAVVVAAREVLNIALRREEPTSYRQAINFGGAIAPSVLAPDKRILRRARESELASYYAELAAAESASTGITITRLEYIEKEIAKLEQGINALPMKLMKSRLKTLRHLRQEIRPKEYTENKLIIRDALKVKRNLIVSGDGADYKEYDAGDDRVLRICVLHPDPPEHKLGADLVYEFHDLEKNIVRTAFVQYKLWDGRSLSHDPRMAGQLTRLRSFGCKGGLQNSGADPRRNALSIPTLCDVSATH